MPISAIPLSAARRTMLASKGPANIWGKRVRMSIRTAMPPPARSAFAEALFELLLRRVRTGSIPLSGEEPLVRVRDLRPRVLDRRDLSGVSEGVGGRPAVLEAQR